MTEFRVCKGAYKIDSDGLLSLGCLEAPNLLIPTYDSKAIFGTIRALPDGKSNFCSH